MNVLFIFQIFKYVVSSELSLQYRAPLISLYVPKFPLFHKKGKYSRVDKWRTNVSFSLNLSVIILTSHPHQQGHLHNYILLSAAPTPKLHELFEPLNHGVKLYGKLRCFQVLSNISIKTTSSAPSFH